MSLLATAVLLVALVALVVAGGVGLTNKIALRRLSMLPPRARIGWLLGILASPIVCGVVVATLALGHCVAPRMVGLDDDCRGLRGLGCAFCVFVPGHPGLLAWTLAFVVLAAFSARVSVVFRGVLRARRAHDRLRTLAFRRTDGIWHVPGVHAFVVGWPAAVVCIGEQLVETLEPAAVRAVTAHEEGHRLRGDVVLRTAARVLALAQLPGTAKELLGALDLAIEQACDEHACAAVEDPLIVADALLGAARLQQEYLGESLACVPVSLPARIQALCAAEAQPPHVSSRWVGVFVVLLLIGGLFQVHQIHIAAEAAMALINR